jgi:hypothetical protein
MGALLRIAAPLLVEAMRAGVGVGGAARRGVLATGLAVGAAFAAVVAVGCGIAALWIYMIPLVGRGAAPLVCAGALLVIALVSMLIGKMMWPERPAAPSSSPSALLESLGQIDASGIFGEHKGTFLLGALILGLILGSGAVSGGKRSPR